MEAFDMQFSGSKYNVNLMDDGTFLVRKNGMKIGSVYPEPGNLVLEWKSDDNLDEKLVDKLGEMISNYALGTV